MSGSKMTSRFPSWTIISLFGLLGAQVLACTFEEKQKCKAPNCHCPSLDIPAELPPFQTPQIVFLTFDDAVTITNYPLYEELLFKRKNPNNSPISASFFVTHEYNDYSLVHELYRRGHEIALHSITHQTDTDYWKYLNASMWMQEVVQQRLQMSYLANIPATEIMGLRAPFLQTGGDTMYQVLHANNFKYDCSRPTWKYMEPGLWPHTYDYGIKFQDCQIEPCPQKPYPGFWNVPMVDLVGGDGNPCAMLDTCLPLPKNAQEAYDLLKKNFDRQYNGNRSPFGVFTHAAWLSSAFPGRKEGYAKFLDYLGTRKDVYIVSVSKGLEWMRYPTTVQNINQGKFFPWAPKVDLPSKCKAKYSCHYIKTPLGSERYMTSCVKCPKNYPWLGNPLGLNLNASL